MRVAVVTASKHGSTAEIGERIAAVLTERGIAASAVAASEVQTLEGCVAVVLGSAVYMSQWMESARDFISRFQEDLGKRPVWAFSCGLAGLPDGEVEAPGRASSIVNSLGPVEHITFKGCLRDGDLGVRERSIVYLAGVPLGDYRQWEHVEAWARGIADHLCAK